MGYYINPPECGSTGKDRALIDHHGAKQVVRDRLKPNQGLVFKPDVGLICVVSNGAFEAAAFIYNEDELEAFNDPDDHRPKIWLEMDLVKAAQMAGYKLSID